MALFSVVKRFSGRQGLSLGRPILYYDAQCRLCAKVVGWLRRLDVFHSLEFIGDLDKVATDAGLDQADLDRSAWLVDTIPLMTSGQAMTFPLVRGKGRGVYQGFYAFRRVALRLPLLWPFVPILWFPGVNLLGIRIYRWVAEHRSTVPGCGLTSSPDDPDSPGVTNRDGVCGDTTEIATKGSFPAPSLSLDEEKGQPLQSPANRLIAPQRRPGR